MSTQHAYSTFLNSAQFQTLWCYMLLPCSYALFHYILADGLHHFIKCKKVVIHLELSENLISTTHATTHTSTSGSSERTHLFVSRSYFEHPVHILPGLVVSSTQPQKHTSIVQCLWTYAYHMETHRTCIYVHIKACSMPRPTFHCLHNDRPQIRASQ